MMFSSTRQWISIGIVSYGTDCTNLNSVSVYSRVYAYMNWIESMNVTGIEYAVAVNGLRENSTAMTTTTMRNEATRIDFEKKLLIIFSYFIFQ